MLYPATVKSFRILCMLSVNLKKKKVTTFLYVCVHSSVLPCAANGDMCWCERLWIWCLYAYTASTNTMMHPMMPPATGPTGALLIMLRDATSSSVEEIEKIKGEEGVRSGNTTS